MTECFCLWASQVSDISPSLADVANCRVTSATSPTSADCIHNWVDCREDLSTCTWCFLSGENEAKSSDDFQTDRPCLLSVAISTLHQWWSQSASCLRPVSMCWPSSREIPEISYYCHWTSDRIVRILAAVDLGRAGGRASCAASRVDRRPRRSDCKDVWHRNNREDTAPSRGRRDDPDVSSQARNIDTNSHLYMHFHVTGEVCRQLGLGMCSLKAQQLRFFFCQRMQNVLHIAFFVISLARPHKMSPQTRNWNVHT